MEGGYKSEKDGATEKMQDSGTPWTAGASAILPWTKAATTRLVLTSSEADWVQHHRILTYGCIMNANAGVMRELQGC